MTHPVHTAVFLSCSTTGWCYYLAKGPNPLLYMNPAVRIVNTDAVCAARRMDAVSVSLPSTCTSSSGPTPLLTKPFRGPIT